MRIVLGGSRHLEFIPNEIADRLLGWMENSSDFLVGDAPGTDRAFQVFLDSKRYPAVCVYTSFDQARNNLGSWNVEIVKSGLKSKTSAVHAFKDRKMSQLADLGLMIWDCKSAGTLSNVIDLVSQRKNCFVWVATDSELYQFDNVNSLEKWMTQYPNVRAEAIARLSAFKKRENRRKLGDAQQNLFS